ncbi:Transcription factor C6 protein [Pyrenophora tritici-repentis]|uniref:Transcription factor C6 protein n=1 Tax=Pyrenophora tritici-repentis TaxID=45151 RepID=A0A2W1GXI4_9PLEO|nr:Transcription factor C6 protein [Pyrenophora tritici-repentis]KAI1511732.1 Transcription factor C6 protein [Pyrenophora tritici-repentis]KAI1683583.1 Transcription factor C6 protein [Pyrenophora tritici-repentis]PZC95966.1 Fungal-trans multi-domain protein [Pyrenophora tritici-repentis]PZD37437.1 Fungal-trans multi-domain protein [Pyrenophora tritici-repentis]
MSRPSSVPSHSGPPPSYSPYPVHHASASRPEIVAPSLHARPRDSTGSQNNAQQLPSLRTLLEPELLDKKSTEPPLRPGATQLPYGHCGRYESSSPTLKRRHEYDGYVQGYPEHNAIASQTPYHHRQALSTNATPSTTSKPGSGFGVGRIELQRRPSFAHPSQHDTTGDGHRHPSSTSETAGTLTSYSSQPELGFDPSRPVRMRRLDGPSRAPIRSSRCVGQRDIPGEGLCYVYEDGTYCRAIIDGEAVNPSWGITKAGKPRKRLAQACLTCREKKIKCEPGFPKCHQCAKSQRVCRGGINQNNASGETSPSNSGQLFKTSSSELLSPAASLDKNKAPGELRNSSKKVDTWNAGTPFRHQKFRPNTLTNARDMSVQSYDSDWSGSANDQDDPGRGSYSDQLALQWEQDPFETDSRLTIQLLNLYFLNAGRATYGMFPRRPFLAWVETNRDKHQDHLMILYSVLAMGSLFSNDPDKRALGKRFASVASYAAEKRFGKFSLQLCQTRLMLALYYFARGKSQEAWDYCGSALRALSALKLNTEEGVRELVNSNADLDYGFDRWTYEECCRRTFWSGLLMDVSYDITRAPASIDCVQKQRYNGFFGGTLFVINLEDAFVRLPCPDNMYEASTPCDAPFFDDELLSGRPVHSPPLGHMAYLCLISALWGEVLTCTGRAVRRPDVGYERHYDAFYARIYEKLEAWHSILPDNLRYSPQNLDNSILEGYAGTFLSLHALYHAAIIRLNRHVRAHALPTDKIRRNLEQSLRMASSFMSIMLSLATVNRQQRLPATVASEFMFSTPFPGYALMLSIDVLTSAGTVSTLPSLIETLSTTLTCIDELASFWASAKSQQKAVSNRIRQLTDIAAQDRQGTRNGTYGNFWRISNSLETAFGNDDALYKAEDQLLFGVVGQLTGQ